MKKLIIILIGIAFVGCAYSQNLVQDPSFEDFKRCPQNIVQNVKNFPLKYWWLPTKGTTDYFNSCSHKLQTSVPNNTGGSQNARTGEGYIHSMNRLNWAEYIQTKLKEPLLRDSNYYVEFWVSSQEYCQDITNSLGAYFSKVEIANYGSEKPLELEPQVVSNEYIKEENDWVKISGIFKSKGGEQYLVIGAFPKDKSAYKKKKKHRKKSAGYYFDDVGVVLESEYSNDGFGLKKSYFESEKTQLNAK